MLLILRRVCENMVKNGFPIVSYHELVVFFPYSTADGFLVDYTVPCADFRKANKPVRGLMRPFFPNAPRRNNCWSFTQLGIDDVLHDLRLKLKNLKEAGEEIGDHWEEEERRIESGINYAQRIFDTFPDPNNLRKA